MISLITYRKDINNFYESKTAQMIPFVELSIPAKSQYTEVLLSYLLRKELFISEKFVTFAVRNKKTIKHIQNYGNRRQVFTTRD